MTKNLHRYLLLLFISCSFAGCPTAELNGQGAASFEKTGPAAAGQNKLDPSLLIEIGKLKSEHREEQEVAVLLKTKGPLDPVRRAEVEKQGATIGSVLGDIATARIPAGRVEDVSKLEFVIFIEKAKKLQPKENRE